MRGSVVRALCMVACLLLPSLAVAQAGPASSQSKYRELIQKALQEYSAGNWPEAKVFFSDAHALAPNARTFRGLGMTCYEARSYVEAIRYLEQALVNRIQPLTPQLAQESRHVLEQARRFVTTLKLEVKPQRAAVSIDDNPISEDGVEPILLDPGQHTLRARADGYEVIERTLTAEGGHPLNVSLSLIPLAAAKAEPELQSSPEKPVARPVREPYTQQKPVVGAVLAPLGVAGLAVGWVFYTLRQSTRRQLADRDELGFLKPVSAFESDKFLVQGLTSLSAAGVGSAVFALSEYFWLPDDPSVPVWSWAMGGLGLALAGAGIAYAVAGHTCDIGDTMVECQAYTADDTFGPLLALHSLPLLALPLSYALRSAVRPAGVDVTISFSAPSLRAPGLTISGRF